jgi:hypothetical protein
VLCLHSFHCLCVAPDSPAAITNTISLRPWTFLNPLVFPEGSVCKRLRCDFLQLLLTLQLPLTSPDRKIPQPEGATAIQIVDNIFFSISSKSLIVFLFKSVLLRSLLNQLHHYSLPLRRLLWSHYRPQLPLSRAFLSGNRICKSVCSLMAGSPIWQEPG